jgi:hypothetical protein
MEAISRREQRPRLVEFPPSRFANIIETLIEFHGRQHWQTTKLAPADRGRLTWAASKEQLSRGPGDVAFDGSPMPSRWSSPRLQRDRNEGCLPKRAKSSGFLWITHFAPAANC